MPRRNGEIPVPKTLPRQKMKPVAMDRSDGGFRWGIETRAAGKNIQETVACAIRAITKTKSLGAMATTMVLSPVLKRLKMSIL